MISILKKEFNSFFASTIAYIVIGFYLLISSLFLWVFKDNFNILNAGFADINSFFELTPWLFIFLIPAITMKSFADEFSSGTIEILKTKPVTDWNIVLGKFFAALLLVTCALVPTSIYVVSIYFLASPIGNIDFGSIIGSYIGLILLASTFTAIGVFTSILVKKQITSFIVALFLIFICYYGFNAISVLLNNFSIKQIGIYEHYKSISRGVIDTRDIIYFVTTSLGFLWITKTILSNE